ncbi:hypothetical protein PT974_04463 [Cladobotryum mycophilum]|uniref:Uncharacterized protein n=1 Tax=Cladobotryum mycophilum TaxID=491253 RepID=A0ABR0SV78_9HYPO
MNAVGVVTSLSDVLVHGFSNSYAYGGVLYPPSGLEEAIVGVSHFDLINPDSPDFKLKIINDSASRRNHGAILHTLHGRTQMPRPIYSTSTPSVSRQG